MCLITSIHTPKHKGKQNKKGIWNKKIKISFYLSSFYIKAINAFLDFNWQLTFDKCSVHRGISSWSFILFLVSYTQAGKLKLSCHHGLQSSSSTSTIKWPPTTNWRLCYRRKLTTRHRHDRFIYIELKRLQEKWKKLYV